MLFQRIEFLIALVRCMGELMWVGGLYTRALNRLLYAAAAFSVPLTMAYSGKLLKKTTEIL